MSIKQMYLMKTYVSVNDSTNVTEIERAILAIAALISGGTLPIRNVGALPTVGAINNVIIGATTTVVLAAEATRERVVLTNDSIDEKMYIAVGTPAIIGKGFPLDVDSFIVLTPDDGCKLAINAIGTRGGRLLAYQTIATA